jgi:outer membrane protein assembly factor BamD (BamD/ComL family)
MAAQKRLREIRGQRLGKKNEREKAIEDLEKMIEGFPDTYLAKEAKSTLNGLKQKK